MYGGLFVWPVLAAIDERIRLVVNRATPESLSRAAFIAEATSLPDLRRADVARSHRPLAPI